MSRVEIEINGCVDTDKDLDTWIDDFIGWIEGRGEYFGGSIKLYEDDGED